MHYVSCIRRYNALMNKVIWISGVTVSTRAKALVLTVTPLMHIKDYRYHDFPNTEFSYFLTIDTRQ